MPSPLQITRQTYLLRTLGQSYSWSIDKPLDWNFTHSTENSLKQVCARSTDQLRAYLYRLLRFVSLLFGMINFEAQNTVDCVYQWHLLFQKGFCWVFYNTQNTCHCINLADKWNFPEVNLLILLIFLYDLCTTWGGVLTWNSHDMYKYIQMVCAQSIGI